MPLFDAARVQTAHQAEVKQMDSTKIPSPVSFDSSFIVVNPGDRRRPMDTTKKPQAQIVDLGQIEKMVFPSGWVAGEPQPNPGIGTRSYREVYPQDAKDASIGFFYRGLPVSDAAAAAFRAVLEKPTHFVTPPEMRSIKEILSLKTPVDSEQFKCVIAKTIDFNGRRVLMVEGRYPDSGDEIQEIYVDADGSGRFIQEIFYQAPKDLYFRYLAQAKNALQSIAWKPLKGK